MQAYLAWDGEKQLVLLAGDGAEFEPLEVVALGGEVGEKALSRFVLAARTWRGQQVIRFGPSTQVWDLFLHDGAKGYWHLELESDPLKEAEIAAQPTAGATVIDTEGETHDVLALKPGNVIEVKPGTRFNPTKQTPCRFEVLDAGDAKALIEEQSQRKYDFRGKKLKGSWYFHAEEEGKPEAFWLMKKSGGPETKAGRWRTLPDGRQVQITGPSRASRLSGCRPLGAPSLEGSASESKELIRLLSNNLPVPEGFDEDEIEDMDWESAENEVSAAIKVQIAAQLAEGAGISEEEAAQLVHQWATSSNDEDMRSLGIQLSASREFGIPISDWQEGRIAAAKGRGKPYSEPLMAEGQGKTLRAMYDTTQEDLRAAGVGESDTVRLFRGVQFGDKLPDWSDGTEIAFAGNALESWTISPDIAREFSDGIILVANVPASSILSTARSGFGCLNEGEVIAFGSVPGSRVLVWRETD